MNDIGRQLLQLVQVGINLNHYEVENESHKHSGTATDSHYKLVLVSDSFADMGLVQRHQAVYGRAQPLMNTPIHALALHCYTPGEWQQRNQTSRATANCMGDDKP
jgi:BolA protein